VTNRQILTWGKTINYPCIFIPGGAIPPGRAEWRKQLGQLTPAQRIALLAKIARQQARLQYEHNQAKFQAARSA
jgi:hypothetical protein